MFVDASEWGELLVLAGAEYVVGIEKKERALGAPLPKGAPPSYEQLGQASVFGFVQRYEAKEVKEPKADGTVLGEIKGFVKRVFSDEADRPKDLALLADKTPRGYYSLGRDWPRSFPAKPSLAPADWTYIWRYRRLEGNGERETPGDLCLQNWDLGNDYPFGYLLLNKDKAKKQKQGNDWQGGVDYQVMEAAEHRAFGWHEFFKRANPAAGPFLDIHATNKSGPHQGEPVLEHGARARQGALPA